VSTYGTVKVGPYTVTRIREGETAHLFAVLRDDAIILAPTGDEEGDVHFSMPGRQVADRLDVFGIDESAALEVLAEAIENRRSWRDNYEVFENEREHIDYLQPEDWILKVRVAAIQENGSESGHEPGSLGWLLSLIDGLDYRYATRLGLLAFPDKQVTVKVSDRGEGWLSGDNDAIASASLHGMQSWGSTYSPTVVLTEGKTDAEFLSAALTVLRPHLTDLIRFMDFESRPEGSAGALVKSIKSFASAGISNRIVALFDNDSAAEDAMRSLDIDALPENFFICTYPELDIARNYPTLGPPSIDSPDGTLSFADVNGLACSIEMYLGRDVLSDSNGSLRPVQWKSFIAGVKRYQGEVSGKSQVHNAYRAKVSAARQRGMPLSHEDWSGLEMIIQIIMHRRHPIGPLRPATTEDAGRR
jgi:hypothetical protein